MIHKLRGKAHSMRHIVRVLRRSQENGIAWKFAASDEEINVWFPQFSFYLYIYLFGSQSWFSYWSLV